jgi:hypothetical protein
MQQPPTSRSSQNAAHCPPANAGLGAGSGARRAARRTPRWKRAVAFLLLDCAVICTVALVALSWPVLADTSGALRYPEPTACYCACAEAHARGGCAKMCELKKYAARWWATTCAKPRAHSPANNSGSGPRLPHPDHAEHAQL